MTYEPRTLDPSFFSWETEEVNTHLALNAPVAPDISIPHWDELPDNERIGNFLASGSPDAESALNCIADTQWTSPKHSDVSPSFSQPSLELFQEMVWDRTEDLGLTDDEVKDLAIWSGHKFLGFSLGALAQSWDITKDAARSIVRRLDRRSNKPQGQIDIQNACLVTCSG